MGNTEYKIPATFVQVASGTNYRLALSKTTETAWVSKPSGSYPSAIDVTFTAVSQTAGARLVYTLDGSEPTASNGTKVDDGATIHLTDNATLKVGLLINGSVSGIIVRTYEVGDQPIVPFDPYEITVYLKDPTVAPNNWSAVNFYSWDSGDVQFNGNWPGQTITDTKEVNGTKFYYQTYKITARDYYMNFVFNQGGSTAGNNQTEDVINVNKTSFFEVTTQTNKYLVKDVTDEYLPYLEKWRKNDVNGDGEVTVADINAVIEAIFSGGFNKVADVNGDGEIGIADINAVIYYILNGE